jgi:hypothetical protein
MQNPEHDDRPEFADSGQELPTPQPVRGRRGWRSLLTAVGVTVTVGGVAFVLVASAPSRARGATRSARLKWETRRQAVDQAVLDADDASPVQTGGSTPVTAPGD